MDLKLGNIQKIHFVGIGGISMSGLAELLHHDGFEISGTDMKNSEITTHLKDIGIPVWYEHDKRHVYDVDLLVYSSAVNMSNPEIQKALELNIPVIERADLLGRVMENYRFSIAVSGTHGKTTTTSMISRILMNEGLSPTISLGGVMKELNGNIRIGKEDFFVAEACEYCNSFLHLHPNVAIILNIEPDHLDFFKDLDHIRSSFKQFIQNIKPGGVLFIHSEIENFEELCVNPYIDVISFGQKEEDDIIARNIEYLKSGKTHFTLCRKQKENIEFEISVLGIHNVQNALAAIALSDYFKISDAVIKQSLKDFTGIKRRFEFMGMRDGVRIYDDYAHHPTEIKATLKAAKEIEHDKLYCVFQPHTYTRTKFLFEDFVEAFDQADVIFILDIFAAREKNTLNIHASDLVDALKRRGKHAVYLPDVENVENDVLALLSPKDLLITMGAGDVYKIGNMLLKK